MTETAPPETETYTGSKGCPELPKPPDPPEVPKRPECPAPCHCPDPPGGPPSTCLEDLIECQNKVVKKADRVKAFVEELTAIQDKVKSAQVDYTQVRFKDLRKTWKEQDKAIVELIRKLICAVPCWECLLWCRLCPQLTEIRALEEKLNGTGDLSKHVYSLFDLQAWHERNVAQMQARVDRIKLVLTAWENPSNTLGDVLDKNKKLIEDTEAIIAKDSAKAVYDVFMTLLPKHWAIRPRKEDRWEGDDHKAYASEIDEKYIRICECPEGQRESPEGQKQYPEGQKESPEGTKECACDEGTKDDCCGPDAGILNLRQRLVSPLPYIVNPTLLPDIICCLTKERLSPASGYLATAQANLAAVTDEIERTTKQIADKTSSIEANFRAELSMPIECEKYRKKETCDGGDQGNKKQPDQRAS